MRVPTQPHDEATAAQADQVGFRASLLDYIADPETDPHAIRYLADGLLVVRDGRIIDHGDYHAVSAAHPDLSIVDHRGKLLMPGFIDAHVHYPQTTMIAAYGKQLLSWLDDYAFPTERRFADRAHADLIARAFVDELLRNGTTTAVVMCTVHDQSVAALAELALAQGLRLILGKVSMNRNVPAVLSDDAATTYDEGKALIARYHGRGRLRYALTPRFAPACCPAQMAALAALHREHPDTYVHSHLAENGQELSWVASLFPERRSYTDVYDHYGLLSDHAIYAHGIHLDSLDLACLAERGTTLAFCPTSNLFLGSGLFPYARAKQAKVPLAIASDVGAGTTFNILQTLAEGYKVLQLQGASLPVHHALHLSTLGGARSLHLDHAIGNFERGKEADFIVLDDGATPLLRLRCAHAQSLEERLFALMMLADDRVIAASYVGGRCLHRRDGATGGSEDG